MPFRRPSSVPTSYDWSSLLAQDGLTAERLAALNHGTIKTPIEGREAIDGQLGLMKPWLFRPRRDWQGATSREQTC